MTLRPAAFAIPGDIATLTGGYIYERRLLEGLRARGHLVDHLELAPGFPAPTPQEMADGIAQMAAVAPDRPLIVDGLVFGAAEGLEAVRAPMVAMIHHPLAREEGLSAAEADHLYRTERANIALARHILVPSPHTRDILVRDYAAPPGSITIAPPGVDRPARARAPSDPPLILSIGLLHPRKGHDILLDALAQITAEPWRAVIAGRAHDPAHAEALRAQCRDLGLEERVRFAGEVSVDTRDQLYAEATLFALATRYEGYGMVFAEALTNGVPIVATRGGAVPDTVPTEAGLLAAVADASAFAAALKEVLTDAARRSALAEGAAAAARALPGWDDTAAIASKVLQSL
ncbi:MAG: glycosyltransferase family 4 protein [Pseudomonadota bacterium]